MRTNKGKDKDGGNSHGATNEDLEILRKEYRNMQANRNAFAHESDMVRLFLLCNNIYNALHFINSILNCN